MAEEKIIPDLTSPEVKNMLAAEVQSEMKKRFADLAKNSLVKVQYSCSGNSCGIEADDFDIENS